MRIRRSVFALFCVFRRPALSVSRVSRPHFSTAFRVNAIPPSLPLPFTRFAKKMSTESTPNPLLQDWTVNEFGLPPFSTAKPSDFESAIRESMKLQIAELQAIVQNNDPASFENTIAAFDRSGSVFQQVTNMFDNLCSSNGVPELQAVELKMAAPLAAHQNQISSLPGLFDRINKVYESRLDSGLNSEQIRLVERFHLDFVRAGETSHAFALYHMSTRLLNWCIFYYSCTVGRRQILRRGPG